MFSRLAYHGNEQARARAPVNSQEITATVFNEMDGNGGETDGAVRESRTPGRMMWCLVFGKIGKVRVLPVLRVQKDVYHIVLAASTCHHQLL